MNLVIFGYRGYGKSEGTPSEEGVYLDGLAMAKYVFENKDVQVCMTGYHLFFDDYNVSGVCLNDNTEIKNSNDWRDKLFEYGE